MKQGRSGLRAGIRPAIRSCHEGSKLEESLYIKELNNRIYIRARGHITANVCPDLKARVFDRLDAKPAVDDVILDLTRCDYMDSTFMGLIVGFNKRFTRFSDHPIRLFGVNETCNKLLKTIGVARLVSIEDVAVQFPEPMERLGGEHGVEARMVLGAHEDLMELSEENEKRFSALRSALKSSIESEKDI